MIDIELKKLDERSHSDYMLTFNSGCTISARGNRRCSVSGGAVFLNKEDLVLLGKTIKERLTFDYMKNAVKDARNFEN